MTPIAGVEGKMDIYKLIEVCRTYMLKFVIADMGQRKLIYKRKKRMVYINPTISPEEIEIFLEFIQNEEI